MSKWTFAKLNHCNNVAEWNGPFINSTKPWDVNIFQSKTREILYVKKSSSVCDVSVDRIEIDSAR